MGGVIVVDSELGKGSTFIFTILTVSGDPGKIVEHIPVQRDVKADDTRTLRVLLAEDNETTQMLVRSMLERSGHAVTTANDGAEALKAAESADFDIILMDMQMPVMDGPQAMIAIRKLESQIATRPIIALTADAIREHRQGYLESGANVVVTKPVNWPILFSEMTRLTDENIRADSDGNEGVINTTKAQIDKSDGEADSNYGDHILLDITMLEALEEALDKDTLQPMIKIFKKNMDKYIDELNALVKEGEVQKPKGRRMH